MHTVINQPAPADFVLAAGDAFEQGDLMAVVRTMAGEPLAEVRAPHAGFLYGWTSGVAFQKGASLGSCGFPDGLPMVVNYDIAMGAAAATQL